jgi:hypothetical protein
VLRQAVGSRGTPVVCPLMQITAKMVKDDDDDDDDDADADNNDDDDDDAIRVN